MTTFFIILGSFILGLYLLKRKYNNPYKLIFIFGKKGAGKSCLMVSEMLKHLKRGWIVYTDIQDIRIPGVRIFDSSDLIKFRPEPGSVIFLDEVGISMDNRNYKQFPPGLRDFFKYVRKMRCKVYMNSQAFDVDKKVRDTTDRMILQVSILDCISLSRPIKRSITLVEPTAQGESRIADKLSFASIFSWKLFWMPKYFKYFNSLEMPDRELIRYHLPENTLEIGKGLLTHARSKVSDYFHR